MGDPEFITQKEESESIEKIYSQSVMPSISETVDFLKMKEDSLDEEGAIETLEHQVITFKLNDERYAVFVQSVKEIVHNLTVYKLPATPRYVAGIIHLRDHVLTAIDLKRFLRMNATGYSKECSTIILQDGNNFIGILVDEVMEFIHFDEKQIEEIPGSVRDSHKEIILGIVKLQGMPVSLLNTKKIINQNTHTPSQEENAMQTQTTTHTGSNGELDASFVESDSSVVMTQCVGFVIQDDEFAVNIKEVQEINYLMSIIRVPHAPKFVEGVVNLRGQIVPVINLRERFNLEKTGYDKNTRIIIINLENKQVGLIVDLVTEVLRVPDASIKPPPVEAVSSSAGFVEGIAELDDRLIVILNLEKVLSLEEIEGIDNMSSNIF